jgi:hypothetical protein
MCHHHVGSEYLASVNNIAFKAWVRKCAGANEAKAD